MTFYFYTPFSLVSEPNVTSPFHALFPLILNTDHCTVCQRMLPFSAMGWCCANFSWTVFTLTKTFKHISYDQPVKAVLLTDKRKSIKALNLRESLSRRGGPQPPFIVDPRKTPPKWTKGCVKRDYSWLGRKKKKKREKRAKMWMSFQK